MTPIDRRNYFNDPRTHAAFRTKRVTVLDQDLNRAKVSIDLGETTEEFIIHTSWIVCPTCRGRGEVVDPEIDASGISREALDADMQLRDDYFGGRLSIKCPECQGQRVVLDHDHVLTQLPAEVQIALTELEDADEEFLRVQMAEMAFGC